MRALQHLIDAVHGARPEDLTRIAMQIASNLEALPETLPLRHTVVSVRRQRFW
jgi:hypothetical protein